MPISPTYPGVYIDELPSAVRTIIGVPTSIAAFVGTAPRGATDQPVHITSWEDYEQEFGGLAANSAMSYAVYQFYQNGGSEAEIVRILALDRRDSPPSPPDDKYPTAATIVVKRAAENGGGGAGDNLTLTAVSKGAWGTKLRARVDYETAEQPELAKPAGTRTTYNLTICDTGTGVVERYLNVSTDPASARGLANVLTSSRLVRPLKGETVLPPKFEDVPEGEFPFSDGKYKTKQNGNEVEKDKEGNWYSSAAQAHTATGTTGQDGTEAPTKEDYLGVGVAPADGKTGIYQLRKADLFNMLCLPGTPGQLGESDNILSEAAKFCVDERAMLIVDPPAAWTDVRAAAKAGAPGGQLPLTGDNAKNAAVYFPTVDLPDPEKDNLVRAFPPCGVVAGIWARTDVQRGVWKAPAGIEASLGGVNRPSLPMTDLENGRLNPLGINCLRQLPVVGNVVWGARTLVGADLLANQWKYVPVRRLALFIEESLFRGTQWVVFEPNDEPLWSLVRLNVGAFMNNLFRQGAFQGRTPQEAYLVRCDKTNNPQNDIDRGIVNILVGFAPLKPAEFVIIHIQQLAGQIQV